MLLVLKKDYEMSLINYTENLTVDIIKLLIIESNFKQYYFSYIENFRIFNQPGVLLVPPDLARDEREYFGAPLCTTVTFSLRYVPGPGVLKAFADCVLE